MKGSLCLIVTNYSAKSSPLEASTSRLLGFTDSLNGTSTISASTETPGVSEYSSGSLTLYLVPTSEASHGTHARAILVSNSGYHQGDVT